LKKEEKGKDRSQPYSTAAREKKKKEREGAIIIIYINGEKREEKKKKRGLGEKGPFYSKGGPILWFLKGRSFT